MEYSKLQLEPRGGFQLGLECREARAMFLVSYPILLPVPEKDVDRNEHRLCQIGFELGCPFSELICTVRGTPSIVCCLVVWNPSSSKRTDRHRNSVVTRPRDQVFGERAASMTIFVFPDTTCGDQML